MGQLGIDATACSQKIRDAWPKYTSCEISSQNDLVPDVNEHSSIITYFRAYDIRSKRSLDHRCTRIYGMDFGPNITSQSQGNIGSFSKM